MSFDEPDEWFTAVGESDCYLTDGPEHISEPGDEEGMSFPYVSGLPAMVDDRKEEGDPSRTVNDLALGESAPNPTLAFRRMQSTAPPNTSSSSWGARPRVALADNGTGRRRLRKKTRTGPSSDSEYFDKKRLLFMKHEVLSSYRR